MKRCINPEDLYEFKTIQNIRLSPDGQNVLFKSQRVDRKTEKKYSNLWILPVTSPVKAHPFTYGNQNDTSPSWSPDGSQIAFLSNRGDLEKPAQIYLIPSDGGGSPSPHPD